jgi:murein DD-endopeptidase MepM/ murein hydrolase activator NlpD
VRYCSELGLDRRKVGALGAILLAMLVGIPLFGRANAGQAADIPGLIFPFPEGQEWRITCAYADGTGCEHADNQWNRYALDFQRVGGATATEGQPVRAAAAGTVTVAGWGGADSFGWYVEIDHGAGYETVYAHMQSALQVSAGQPVSQGQVIGYASCTGRCTGPHIHFVLWLDGESVPPEPMCGLSGFDDGQVHTNCSPQGATPTSAPMPTADPLPGPTGTPTPAPPPGDGNCDRAVNSVDAALILQLDAGLTDSLACLGSADANGDGAVNPVDAALILQFEAGLIENLTPGT